MSSKTWCLIWMTCIPIICICFSLLLWKLA
ncbi:hypothetical protein [Escherichia phage CLB_P2]|uniref:Uncharacterized protein n=1 Tax=Escherichia phage JS98 TaxID=293178 RepID=A8R9R1_9CAUD|nr:outer membrane protein [Escherichia phage JS98]ABX11175.1 hypothetical protein EpJS98_0261 [Escherichia phage JS98]UNI73186.1 hypothetical protein [Escherichia phage CLB_P2]